MNQIILCSFYGKNDDICDVGCGYISSSDVPMIIKFCSSNYRVCGKYRELADRFPQEILQEPDQNKVLATAAGYGPPQRLMVSVGPVVKPFKVKWPLPYLWSHLSARAFRAHRPFAGGYLEPISLLQTKPADAAGDLPNAASGPAPLGLLGFGVATLLVTLNYAGFVPLSAFIMAIGILYGGLLQIVAGIMEWRRNNTFGTTAFISYGIFWLTLVASMVMSEVGLGSAPSSAAMVAYLSMWGMFTAVLFVGTLKLGRTFQVFFGSLTVLFVLLAAAGATGSATISLVAGCQGILTSSVAIFPGMKKLLRSLYQAKPMTISFAEKTAEPGIHPQK